MRCGECPRQRASSQISVYKGVLSMQTNLATFVALYAPLVSAIVCAIAFCRTMTGQKRTTFNFKPFGSIVEYKLEVSNVLLIRGLLIVGIVGSLLAYLLYDYKTFFPENYQMEVFFDERGLSQSLSEFSAEDLKGLSIPLDRSKYQEL